MLPPPSVTLGARDIELRLRPFYWQRGGPGQRQRGTAIDHARQLALAVAQVIEQRKAQFADEPRPLGDSCEKWRQGGFPGARHDQRAAVIFALESPRQRELVLDGDPAAGQIDYDRATQPGHVI